MKIGKLFLALMLLSVSLGVDAHDRYEALLETRGGLANYFWALVHPWVEQLANTSGLLALAVINLLALISLIAIRRHYAFCSNS